VKNSSLNSLTISPKGARDCADKVFSLEVRVSRLLGGYAKEAPKILINDNSYVAGGLRRDEGSLIAVLLKGGSEVFLCLFSQRGESPLGSSSRPLQNRLRGLTSCALLTRKFLVHEGGEGLEEDP